MAGRAKIRKILGAKGKSLGSFQAMESLAQKSLGH